MTKQTPPEPEAPLTAHGGGYLAEPFDADERQDALLALATTQPEAARLLTELFGLVEGKGNSGASTAELAKFDERLAAVEATVAATTGAATEDTTASTSKGSTSKA